MTIEIITITKICRIAADIIIGTPRSHTNFEVQVLSNNLRLVEGAVSVVRSFNMIKRRNQVDQPELLSISKGGNVMAGGETRNLRGRYKLIFMV